VIAKTLQNFKALKQPCNLVWRSLHGLCLRAFCLGEKVIAMIIKINMKMLPEETKDESLQLILSKIS